MEKKVFQFKTNINCGSCVATVTPHLEGAQGICEWRVDTLDRNKILTVTATDITPEEVVDLVNKSGFKADPLHA